jgi:hypothetical protein
LFEKEDLISKVDSFDLTFAMLTAQRKKIEKTPKSINSGLFKIDCNETRNLCINSSRNSLKKSQNILLKIIRERLEYCRAWASKSVRMLGTRVFTVEEYVEQKISLTRSQ